MKKETQQIMQIEICMINPENNLRWEPKTPADPKLKESIRIHRQREPITVGPLGEDGKYPLIDGAGRLKAMIELGNTHVDAKIASPDSDDPAMIVHQAVVNSCRTNFSPSMMTKTMFMVMDQRECNSSEACSILNISPSCGSRTKSRANLDTDVLRMIDDGSIPKDCGYHISRIPDASLQRELAQRIIAEKLTRDEVAQIAAETIANLTGKPKRGLIRASIKLPGKRSVIVAGPSLDLSGFIGILEEMLKQAKKERKRGISLSTFQQLSADLLKSEGEA